MKKACRSAAFFAFMALGSAYLGMAPSALWAADTLGKPAAPPVSDMRPLGRADYHWVLHRLDGEEAAFSAFKDKVVFLHFWATWCPHCLLQLSSIERLQESLGNDGKVAFVMATYENRDIVRRYLSKKNLRLPVYRYEGAVPAVFGPTRRIPRTYIVDRKGLVVYEHIGAAGWDDELILGFLKGLL